MSTNSKNTTNTFISYRWKRSRQSGDTIDYAKADTLADTSEFMSNLRETYLGVQDTTQFKGTDSDTKSHGSDEVPVTQSSITSSLLAHSDQKQRIQTDISSVGDLKDGKHGAKQGNTSSFDAPPFTVVELSAKDLKNKCVQSGTIEFSKLFDNPIDSQNQVPKIENDDTSQDLISIPSILARMAKNWQAEGTEKGYHVDEDDDEYQEYFAGMPPIEMSHSELLLFMEKTLSKGLSANSPLSRVKISKKKAREIKINLWMNGTRNFLQDYLFSPLSKASADTVLAALGFPLPEISVKRSNSEDINMLVQKAVQFTTMPRKRLPTELTIDKLVDAINKAKNIIVLTGAGISTSLGIPDFRSQSGLYTKLASLGLSDPQEVFDLNIFRQDPSVFYAIAREILPVTTKFSPTHLFIKLLQDKGKLLRNYTQNIDNLEHYAGILPEKMVQCHGSFATATCQTCGYKTKGENLFGDIRNQIVSRCPVCKKVANEYITKAKLSPESLRRKKRKYKHKGQYSANDSNSDSDDQRNKFIGLEGEGINLHKQLYPIFSPQNKSELFLDPDPSSKSVWDREGCPQLTPSMVSNPQFGIMKPDITFFGEPLPTTFEETLIDADDHKCDLLLCIGTSLKVSPVSETVRIVPRSTVQVYVSKTPISHNEFDVTFLGACDDVLEHLCNKLGWKMDHPMAKHIDFGPYIEYLPQIATYQFNSEQLSKSKGVEPNDE